MRGSTFFGWACNEDRLDDVVALEIFRGGRLVAKFLANGTLDGAMHYPRDLIGHAFLVTLERFASLRHFTSKINDVSIRIAGTDIVLAETTIGYRNIVQAGLQGHCDLVRAGVVNGWAWRPAEPQMPVEVALFVDGRFLTRATCIRERDDLRAAGIGDGHFGFQVTLPKNLRDGATHIVEVVVADNGAPLESGRVLVEGDKLFYA